MQKMKVIIKSPRPKLENALLMDDKTILVTFDVNIQGPSECHVKENGNPQSCCNALFETNKGIMSSNVSVQEGKKYFSISDQTWKRFKIIF